MIAAVTAGGAQISIVVKHISSVMEHTNGMLEITMMGGDTIRVQADYVEFVAQLSKMI